MHLHIGCAFRFDTTWPTPAVFQVQPYPDGPHQVLSETWQTTPESPLHAYRDIYGNLCQRLMMPGGAFQVRYDAVVAAPDAWDELAPTAAQLPVEALPDETLLYTLPSRYCLSDALSDTAWELFGAIEGGWARVQAICDWAHTNIRFQYGTSTPFTTAADVYAARVGVCRDFAHLGVTFCRALNIPARYVFGYLPDIGVPPPDAPMDFCAWFEAYLDGRWRTFDPRNNTPRTGRVVIGRGRDALDVAMVTTYGAAPLHEMTVIAEEAQDQGAHQAIAPAVDSPAAIEVEQQL